MSHVTGFLTSLEADILLREILYNRPSLDKKETRADLCPRRFVEDKPETLGWLLRLIRVGYPSTFHWRRYGLWNQEEGGEWAEKVG